MKVWVRAGDQDDYHDFDSIDTAAEYIHNALHDEWDFSDGHRHALERYGGSGLVGVSLLGTDFIGDNAISLFWGNDEAQYMQPMSDNDLVWLGQLLDE